MNADPEKLKSVNEIGPRIASSIMAYFADKENIEIIKRLKSYNIKFSSEEESEGTGKN